MEKLLSLLSKSALETPLAGAGTPILIPGLNAGGSVGATVTRFIAGDERAPKMDRLLTEKQPADFKKIRRFTIASLVGPFEVWLRGRQVLQSLGLRTRLYFFSDEPPDSDRARNAHHS